TFDIARDSRIGTSAPFAKTRVASPRSFGELSMVQCFVDVWLSRFGDSDENAVRMILPSGKTASNYTPKPKVSSRLPSTNPAVQLNYVLDRSTGPAGSP